MDFWKFDEVHFGREQGPGQAPLNEILTSCLEFCDTVILKLKESEFCFFIRLSVSIPSQNKFKPEIL
jgi:hypothetical protein